ncbi:hypothetical protein Taro_048387 [Colocasia esculenta]|uniref:Glycosyltransferase n=1 Tax=Colocasia esculenta TaxID=4460 RepID=A0A843WY81_COLES|nr:hypothetical protein [Colocasia esculenta]
MEEHAVTMDGESCQSTPHLVLVPFFAPGHMIPMVDIARLLAERGVLVSFITTPVNATRTRTAIERSQALGLPIRFVELPFPCAELGLPEGCESVDLVPSLDTGNKFFNGLSILREPLAAYLRQQCRPSCIISDMCHPWTQGLANEFGVPRLAFHATCCFSVLCHRNIRQYKVTDGFADEMESFVVPGLPHRVEITKDQVPFFEGSDLERYRNELIEADETSDGVVFDSFYELETLYIDSYQKATGKKAWAVGPVCFYNNLDVEDRAARGDKAAVDSRFYLSWLDSRKPGSVILISFGSLSHTPPSQIIEIGMGLEASGNPFILVIKANDQSQELEDWLLQGGFEERTKERSLVIRGWAPQLAILSHPAVGGFVSHCGWNSVLEAISVGVPMITWPLFADHFLIERLVVEVLRVGISIEVKRQVKWMVSGQFRKLVKREEVEAAVRALMDGGVEGQERRERARLLAETARRAAEVGGSSHENLTSLIRDVSLLRASVNDKGPEAT